MSFSTYSEYQNRPSSEKLGLVILEAGRRLMGWELDAGNIYKLEGFPHPVIVSIKSSGTALTEVATYASITPGTYYLDRVNQTLYLYASDSSNPNSLFLACVFKLFFCNAPVALSWNLADGFEVPFLPYLKSTSDFGVELDNKNLLGFAIEGSGKVSFFNDRAYWGPIYDKYYFENQKCVVYSWHRTLPLSQAKLIYRGSVQGKEYSEDTISFALKDLLNGLRGPIPLENLSDYAGASIPPSLRNAKQRLVYGYVNGMRPTNVDQPNKLTGYTITGTGALTNGSAIVTGTGTTFLTELSPEDEVIFGSDTDSYSIKTVDSATQITLTENYEGSTSTGRAIRVRSSQRPKRYYNRDFLVAGHSLREPTTTVTEVYSLSSFEVSDPTDFVADEPCVINNENVTIRRVSGRRITLNESLASCNVGDTIKVVSVRNVYINDRLLTHIRDYTYSASNATITLQSLAEFNVAPVRTVTGTLTFTSASRAVTGSGTFFKKELEAGDWIKRNTESDWFEILSIESDTALTLRTASSYSGVSVTANNKSPEMYDEGKTVLSCDCLGATANGTTSGTFLHLAPRIVKDILTRVGLGDLINEDSFDNAEAPADQFLGLVVPDNFSDTKTKNARDIINLVNQSVFGSVYQNEDFELSYSVLSPEKPSNMLTLTEAELIRIGVESDNSNITKKTTLQYAKKEYDPESAGPSVSTVEVTSDVAQYLATSSKEVTIETALSNEADATIFAYRRAFILEASTSVLKLDLGLQAATSQINDKVDVSHPQLYERIGTSTTRKIGGVSLAKKDIFGSSIEVDDLSNAFGRCAAIADNETHDYDEASEDELAVSGFITDEYGMMDNDDTTFGINVIW